MNSNAQLLKNLQLHPLKENINVNPNCVVEAMYGCKPSKFSRQELPKKNSAKTESCTKLGLSRYGRSITKRAALGSIGNNAAVYIPIQCDKKKDSQANITKKTRASKFLLGPNFKNLHKTISGSTVNKPKEIEITKEFSNNVPSNPTVEERTNKEMPIYLPKGVENVDAECSGDPQMCSENAESIIIYMRHLESIQNIKPNFLSRSLISGTMRAVLINWLAEVHLQFKLLPETLYSTVNIVDRYFATDGHLIKRPKIQLVGVCAMLIACKYEEMYIPQVEDFVYITAEAYTSKQIIQMELHMLQELNFQLGRPVAITFLRRYSYAGSVDLLQHWLAKYILESCLVDYELAHVRPSEMAAAALLLSLKLQDPKNKLDKLWNVNLRYYSGYTLEELTSSIQKVAMVVKSIHTSKFNAAYNKYNSTSNLNIPSLVILNSEAMD